MEVELLGREQAQLTQRFLRAEAATLARAEPQADQRALPDARAMRRTPGSSALHFPSASVDKGGIDANPRVARVAAHGTARKRGWRLRHPNLLPASFRVRWRRSRARQGARRTARGSLRWPYPAKPSRCNQAAPTMQSTGRLPPRGIPARGRTSERRSGTAAVRSEQRRFYRCRTPRGIGSSSPTRDQTRPSCRARAACSGAG